MSEKDLGIIEFKKCPVCGSEKRYCESLGNQEKARGHMRKELNFCFLMFDGVCMDKGLEAKLPMGTELPAYHVTADICSDCGTLYVTSITPDKVAKKPNLVLPGQSGPQFGGMSRPQHN